MPGTEDKDPLDGFDMAAAVDQVSGDLFGEDESKNVEAAKPVIEAKAEEPKVREDPAVTDKVVEPPKDASAENTAAVDATGAPKTWSKEAISSWATIPPTAQAEILKREQDMFRGMEGYKAKAEIGTKFDAVTEPYRAMLASENVDPVELYKNFAGNHFMLLRGSEDTKLDILSNLVSFYRIDLDKLYARMDPNNRPHVDPALKETQDRLARMEAVEQQRTQSAATESQQRINREVEAFASDPKNIYFEQVSPDMAELLRTKAASNLQQAYELAVYRNPLTRQKEVDRLTAERTSSASTAEAQRVAAAKAATAGNVRTTAKTRDGTIPVGTMDDTLRETMAKIEARG